MSKVLGLTGQEPVIEIKYQTFCSLCKRLIHRGDQAVSLGSEWLIHPDCALAAVVKAHNTWYRGEVKAKKPTRRTRGQEKKIHEGTGEEFCSFCNKLINASQTFVKEEKKNFHNQGRNSCVTRYRRVVNATKSSVS
jgi:hypothetical protein